MLSVGVNESFEPDQTFLLEIEDQASAISAIALRTVQKRADLLKTTDLLGAASIDKYSFTRDAYLQFRRAQIYDGNPPEEDDAPSAH